MKYSGIGLYGGSAQLFSLHIIPRISKMSSVIPNFFPSDPYYFLFCATYSFLRYENEGKFLRNLKNWAKLHPPSMAISVKKRLEITKPFWSPRQFLLNCHHRKKCYQYMILHKVSNRKYFNRLQLAKYAGDPTFYVVFGCTLKFAMDIYIREVGA